MNILIAGSRITTHEMIELVNKTIDDLQSTRCHILVGDSIGIDKAVIDACDCIGISVTVYGVYSVGRTESKQFNSYKHIVTPSYLKSKDRFIFRDRWMVEHCDKYIGFCYKNSYGTVQSYEYSKLLGKLSDIYHFR